MYIQRWFVNGRIAAFLRQSRHDFLLNACFSRLYAEIFLKNEDICYIFRKVTEAIGLPYAHQLSHQMQFPELTILLHNHVIRRRLCKGYAVVTPRFFHVKSTAKFFSVFGSKNGVFMTWNLAARI